METAVGDLKRSLIAPGFEDFDYDLYYAGEVDYADILKKLVSPPFASKKRLVVIKNLKKLLPTERQALVNYAQSPNPTTCLAVVAPKDQAPQGLVTELKNYASVINFSPLRDNQLLAAIAAQARTRGLSLEPGAAELLRDMVGSSLFTVNSELDKLKIFLGAESKVTRELIAAVSGTSREYQVWELSQTVTRRNRKKALEILCRLENWKVEPAFIVNSLAVKFLKLFADKSGDKKPKSDYRPASGATRERTSGWSRAGIIKCLQDLKAIDSQIKQSRNDPFYLLQSFITENIF